MTFLRICSPLLVVGCLSGPVAAFPLPAFDRYGDPLPTGSAARLGTVRDLPDVLKMGHAAAVRRVFATSDGCVVSVGADRTARVWNVATTDLLRTIPVPERVGGWSLTPDGSTLIGVGADLNAHRWPLGREATSTTVELREAQRLRVLLAGLDAQVPAENTLGVLVSQLGPPTVSYFSVWDLGTGRLIRWGDGPAARFGTEALRLSPDGRTAASPDAMYDTRTGTVRGAAANPFGLGGTSVFSPDSRLLASGTARDLRVWEVATGRVVADLPGGPVRPAAFSPDGRRLAFFRDDRLFLSESGQRQPVVEFSMAGLRPVLDPPVAVFSPDGRTLATGHEDGTILLWKVPPPVPDGRWSEADAAAAWDVLAEESPANAYPALWQFADFPAEGVRFLRGKFPLAPAAGPDEWPRLIAGLDSPRFADREAASKRVRELGRAAEKPLRDALKYGPSPEQVARIEALLAALEPPARPRGDDLRAIRAVAAVEACGTDEARRLLSEWAERGAPPRLADEAGRAADRLKYRK